MEINKAYNHKIITDINNQLQNVDNNNIISIFNDIKPINYIDITDNINGYFNINIHSRKINIKKKIDDKTIKNKIYDSEINNFIADNELNKIVEWIFTD